MLDPGSAFRVLVAGTAGGKTWAATLPIVLASARAVLVYPTNALLDDQRRSILGLLRDHLGVPVQEIGSAEPTGEPGGYTLVRLDADSLEKRRCARHRRAKGAVLAELLDPSGPRLILTNPDVLYQILAWRYQEPGRHVASLQAYSHLVVDEFHLYGGIELANLLGMLGMARAIGAFETVTVLSATTDPAVVTLLEKTIGTQAQQIGEDANTSAAPTGEQRVLAHDVRLAARVVATPDALVNEVVNLLNNRRSFLRELRKTHESDQHYVPAVAIVNSVVDARLIEETLIDDKGWDPDDIAPVRGLVGRAAREAHGRLVVLGTSAIEVGVDFSTHLLCFQAGDRSSFIQRLGRVGRHGQGEAVLLGDDREVGALEALALETGGEVDRAAVAAFAAEVYRQRDSRAWFATTEGGATLLLCLEKSVCAAIRSDRGSISDGDLEGLFARVREILSAHAGRLDGELARQLARLRVCLAAARGNSKHAYGYLLDLTVAYPTFRTATPTVQVWDHGEALRRGRTGAVYDVEVIRLARQGRGVRIEHLDDGELRVTVAAYERGGRAWLNENLEPGRFYRAGHVPGLRLCNPHGALPPELFDADKQVLFVAARNIRDELDWRIPVVSCGREERACAALGWAALLLREICRRGSV